MRRCLSAIWQFRSSSVCSSMGKKGELEKQYDAGGEVEGLRVVVVIDKVRHLLAGGNTAGY